MLHALQTLAGTAVMERVVLLLNHVLSAEPAATMRLRSHAGRCMQLHLSGWPSLLPALPVLAFRITPAGLLEWSSESPEPDLRIEVDASNPAAGLVRALLGERPAVEIAGDAAFAADVSWLFDNLRWEVQDDLARVIGDAPAHQLGRLASAVGDALRAAVRQFGGAARPVMRNAPPAAGGSP